MSDMSDMSSTDSMSCYFHAFSCYVHAISSSFKGEEALEPLEDPAAESPGPRRDMQQV